MCYSVECSAALLVAANSQMYRATSWETCWRLRHRLLPEGTWFSYVTSSVTLHSCTESEFTTVSFCIRPAAQLIVSCCSAPISMLKVLFPWYRQLDAGQVSFTSSRTTCCWPFSMSTSTLHQMQNPKGCISWCLPVTTFNTCWSDVLSSSLCKMQQLM